MSRTHCAYCIERFSVQDAPIARDGELYCDRECADASEAEGTQEGSTTMTGEERVDAIITNVIEWTRREADTGYPCKEVQLVAKDLDTLTRIREAAASVDRWTSRCGGDLVQVPRDKLDTLLRAIDGEQT